MSVSKLGMIFNLCGSFLLGLHIVGLDRLKSWENNVKKLPNNISTTILNLILSKIVNSVIQRQMDLWPKEVIQGILQVKSQLEDKDSIQFPRDWSFFYKNPFLRISLKSLFLGLFIWAVLLIDLAPLIILFIILIRPFIWIQEKFKIQSFLGLIGIFLLVVGFLLQILS